LGYSWKIDGTGLFFDFHGEPAGDATGYFKSFGKNTDNQASGLLTTSSEGTHGWYWKNNTRCPVAMTLRAKGDYQRRDVTLETNEIVVHEQTVPGQTSHLSTHDIID